ncbi:MAG TPA: ATP-binding cassette domain-containing protein [Thermomicrobiales bacterium]|nr:ATP-binding cassette domain-containing protein [Thermomicrobiales bacterium]
MHDPTQPAITATNLHRVFRAGSGPFRRGTEIVAVEDISFSVPQGTIFGMLGPNGAGKTTTIKMLSTLLVPTSGSATVAGYDVRRDERQVRRRLGVVLGGDRGLYMKISAIENLRYFGNLYGMRKPDIERRAAELLELVNLADRSSQRVEGFSRGMKQRLHLAKALLHNPPILFLDEPTIGLDPASAVDLRRAVAALVPDHTVLLTTHDMHEADLLCREIAIVDHGRIVAQGTPEELKALVDEGRRVVITTLHPLNGSYGEVAARLSLIPNVRAVQQDLTSDGGGELTILCNDTANALDEALAIMRGAGASVNGVRVLEPTLEDAFLAIAGGRLQ